MGCSDLPPLPLEALICQNDEQAETRCLTEDLCVTAIILSAQIVNPFKDVGAGNSLFAVEVMRLMLIIYLSAIFLYVNDHRDLTGRFIPSIPGQLVMTFIFSICFIFSCSVPFLADILYLEHSNRMVTFSCPVIPQSTSV